MQEIKNKEFEMYCLCLNNSIYNTVKNLGYMPVGLGLENFENYWLNECFKNEYLFNQLKIGIIKKQYLKNTQMTDKGEKHRQQNKDA